MRQIASSATGSTVARRPTLRSLINSPTRLGQIALGLIWCTDGLLKLRPFFFHHFVSSVIDPNAVGQPSVIASPIKSIASIIAPHQALFVALAVLTEITIGIGLLVPRTVKPALLLSIPWALILWLTGEGLGGLFTGTAPTPLLGILGAAPLYIIVGLMVWPRGAEPRSESGFGLLGRRGARAVWAALWLGAAALWLVPSNAGAHALDGVFTAAPSGAGWLTSLHSSAASAIGGSGTTITIALAVVSAGIGLSVIWLRGVRIALLASMALSLSFWVLAEGLGGLFTGQATDVGAGPLMILLAALLLPLATQSAPAFARARVPSHALQSQVSPEASRHAA
jgi:hypothetical protein